MITLSGHSDDLVVVAGDIADEVNAWGRRVRFTIGHPEAAPGIDSSGVIVEMEYAEDDAGGATWSAAVRQLGEDIPVPWPVRFEAPSPGYSVRVTVECPPGTPVLVERRRTMRYLGAPGPWEPYGRELRRAPA